jgi:hypothetical protein
MPKRTAWLKERPGQDRCRQILEVCLAQRRTDTYGRRLRVFSLEELAGMSAAELAKVKASGWLVLPDLITPHAPPCECEDCEITRAQWRARARRD